MVRIHHERERLVELDQPVDQLFRILIVNVVVRGAMNQQQITFEASGVRDGGPLRVAFIVIRGQAHERSW